MEFKEHDEGMLTFEDRNGECGGNRAAHYQNLVIYGRCCRKEWGLSSV